MQRTEQEEIEYWNRLLAKEGLTVDRGRFPTGKRASLKTAESEGKLSVCTKCFGVHTEEGDCSYHPSTTRNEGM
jgi:hypothetical protein